MSTRYIKRCDGRGKIHIYDGEAIKCGLPYSDKYKEVKIEDRFLSNKYNNKHQICRACKTGRKGFKKKRNKKKKNWKNVEAVKEYNKTGTPRLPKNNYRWYD